jgi:multiple sugar transport system ATP-binding protein
MVFQSYGLYPNMTVAENISFPLKIRGTPADQVAQAVRQAAQKVELTDFLERRPRELSGGQRQRVALARAIVRRPSVFLMDEPLSNLDAQLRVSMRVHLKHLHHELGVTTIYVTHDQIEAMTLADRVVVMSKARIQQVGTPEQIYNEPANLFVAGFVGSPSMNLLDGALNEGVFESGDVRVGGFGQSTRSGVVLGVRAEDVHVGSTEGASFVREVFSFELTGDATLVTVRHGARLLTARAAKDFRTAVGDPVGLSLHTRSCHLFDAATQARLRPAT